MRITLLKEPFKCQTCKWNAVFFDVKTSEYICVKCKELNK